MEKIKFSCLFGKCNFTADIEWPKMIENEKDLGFEPSVTKISPLITHHMNTRIELKEYKGLGTGHSKFKGILPSGHEIKVGVSGETSWVEEGFKYLKD